MFLLPALASAAFFGELAFASVSTRCPHPEICFGIESPDQIDLAATRDVFLLVSAPVTYGGVTLFHKENGIDIDGLSISTDSKGTHVSVHRIFAQDEEEDSTLLKEVELLEGSGVTDGIMTASFRCKNCIPGCGEDMDLGTTIGSWTWEYHVRDVPISGTFQFAPSSSASPWKDTLLISQLKSRSKSHTLTTTSHPPPWVVRSAIVHGIFACLAWAFIFPLGGIMIRLCSFRTLLWTHAFLQIGGLCFYTVAVGLGIELGISPHHWWIKEKHAIIGLIIYGLFLVQTFSGYIHHLMFKKYFSRTLWSHFHLWTGRLCITLGMINAGFGFQLRKQGFESWKVVLYTICAVLTWVVYVISAVIGERRKRRRAQRMDLDVEAKTAADDSNNLTPVSTEAPQLS